MAYIDSHNGGMAHTSDQATRALDGLQLLAKRISILTDPEGEFVGEISSFLCICSEVYQEVAGTNLMPHIHELSGNMIRTCHLAKLCLRAFSARGSRFSLYTNSVRLNHMKVMYSWNWDGEYLNSLRLKRCATLLQDELCKALWATNIVLCISKDEPSRYPPWKSDDFLKKYLIDSSILSIPRSHYGGLNQDFLPAYTWVSQKQLDVQDTFGKGRAAASDQDQPYKNIQTSETQEIPLPTSFFDAEAMYTGRTDWDKLFPSTQDRQSSSRYRPPIVGTERSRHRISQSRPSPVIQKLVPPEGTTAGGTEVTLLGSGFYQGLEIIFGDAEATTATFWGEKCLTCTVPPALVPGFVTVSFKHGKSQDFQRDQESRTRACTYKYVDDHEVDKYRFTVQNSGNHIQNSGFDKEPASRQHVTAEVCRTISAISVSKMSPVMLTNLAIMRYLADCLAELDVLSTRNDEIQEEVGRTLMSLRHALASGPLEDDTILSAILLWSMEKTSNDQHIAERHWEGIKELIKLRPDFEITRPLARISLLASLILTKQQLDSVSRVSEVLAVAFRSAMENIMEIEDDNQIVAIASAPTPAATVYSPWSETDAEPPPYMLSPTPLKQACLIYANVNAR